MAAKFEIEQTSSIGPRAQGDNSNNFMLRDLHRWSRSENRQNVNPVLDVRNVLSPSCLAVA